MLTPSYSELMDAIKQDGKVDPRVTSRYTVVLAAAKRARQLTEGAEPLTYAPTDRAVSIAVKEMSEGKLSVRIQDNLVNDSYERLKKDQHKYRAITALSKDDLREDLKDDYTTARTYTLEEDDAVSDIFQPDTFIEPDEADIEEVVDEFELFDDEDIEDDLDLDTEENFEE